MNKKKLVATTGAFLAITAIFISTSSNFTEVTNADTIKESVITTENYKQPKYVFLFIGDGMTYPQIQIASDYLGVKDLTEKDEILKGGKDLSFMEFSSSGTATNYDSTSFAPDSASTATSIATGHKTYSGVIGMDETLTVPYKSIAETLKEDFDYKVGIVTSVTLNHATPAAFYAHQPSRGNYYEIAKELVASDFEYFAGGSIVYPTGADESEENIFDLAKKNGYEVVNSKEAKKINSNTEKVIIINENLDSDGAMPYAIDSKDTDYSLANHVKKGIEVLDNDNGFFMMVEGGKVDWAGHANDAGTVANETIAFSNAVSEAVEFYNKYPDDTLIIVTGDHETGGLSIGYAGTKYDLFLENLNNQKLSFSAFTNDYVSKYIENKTSFDDVMKDVEELFGLKMPDNNSENYTSLELTNYEVSLIKNGYDKSIANYNYKDATQEEYALYGSYDPLTIAITSVLNNKSGISFSSFSHTGLPVGVFSKGVGEELFSGYYDNTDIYNKLISLFN